MVNLYKINNFKIYLFLSYFIILGLFIIINYQKTEFNWLLTRFTGVSAFILLTLGVCLGLSISTKSAYTFLKPPFALQLHNSINVLALFTVISHFSSLLVYKYGAWNILEVLIPFYVKRTYPTENGFNYTYSVANGIIAFYLILIVLITSFYRSKISIKIWRKLHYLSFFAYFSFLIHGFTTGSSSGLWWMKLIYIISFISVLLLTAVRISKLISNNYGK